MIIQNSYQVQFTLPKVYEIQRIGEKNYYIFFVGLCKLEMFPIFILNLTFLSHVLTDFIKLSTDLTEFFHCEQLCFTLVIELAIGLKKKISSLVYINLKII